jgi:hypothetical protein
VEYTAWAKRIKGEFEYLFENVPEIELKRRNSARHAAKHFHLLMLILLGIFPFLIAFFVPTGI